MGSKGGKPYRVSPDRSTIDSPGSGGEGAAVDGSLEDGLRRLAQRAMEFEEQGDGARIPAPVIK